MYSRCSVVLLSLLQLGCAAACQDAAYSVSGPDLEVLKGRVRAFIANQWKTGDVSCEEFGNTTAHLRGYGCAIRGGPAIRQGCPSVLDGEYVVVFERSTLEPRRCYRSLISMLCQPPNKQLQRTVRDKVPRPIGQRAAAELRR